MTFLGLCIALYQLSRQIKQKNIEEERAKWRERMRVLSSEIIENAVLLEMSDDKDKLKYEAKLLANLSELRLRLNPFDKEDRDGKGFTDQEILKNAENLIFKSSCFKSEEFIEKMSLLLKYEWENAKRETELCAFMYKNTNKVGQYRKVFNIGFLAYACLMVGLLLMMCILYAKELYVSIEEMLIIEYVVFL